MYIQDSKYPITSWPRTSLISSMISFLSPPVCNFQLQSESTAATVYLDGEQFVSVASGESLPIVSVSNGQSLPSNCKVSMLEVNRGDGWMSLGASGFSLMTLNSVTTLQVYYIHATKYLKENNSSYCIPLHVFFSLCCVGRSS